MALTQEQLDTLEKGTPIVIHTTFDHFDCDGDVRYKAPYSLAEEHYGYIDPKYVSLPGETVEQPTPKHNPTRLFKKGDVVKMKPKDGRNIYLEDCNEYIDPNELFTVKENEHNGWVELKWGSCGTRFWYDMLELVTPVEELEPYSIDPANTNVLFKCGKKIATFEDDDEAQELCDRLNAEWKQSHQN